MAIMKKIAKKVEKGGKKVSFAIEAPAANSVMLAGDFNEWDYETTPLKRVGRSNIWKSDLYLKPGRYEYKFVVDGNWVSDPRNSNKVRNNFGTENSVIEV